MEKVLEGTETIFVEVKRSGVSFCRMTIKFSKERKRVGGLD